MNILLTGASGFIGTEILKNHSIHRAICRNTSDIVHHDLYMSDLSKERNWASVFTNIDSVIHLAGIAHRKNVSKSELEIVNFHSTVAFARAAADNGVRRFVFVSSILVNGTFSVDKKISVNDIPNPKSYFAFLKHRTEIELKRIESRTNMEVVIVRPVLVYGEHAPANFSNLKKLIYLFPVLPFGFSFNRRDFISVQNLADLLVTCATHPSAGGHTFLASDGEAVSIKEFTNAIAKGLGKKVFQLPIPVGLMRFIGKVTGKSAMIEQLFGNLEVDSSNIQQVLGWTPPFTMEQAMATLKDSDK